MDIRQTKQWGEYLSQIGWKVEKTDHLLIFVKKVPFLNTSVIKIQHPKNPLPFTVIDQIAKKYNALCVIIEPDYRNFDNLVFRQNGYQRSTIHLTHTATIHIDLTQSEKKLFKSFSENARRNIKKAMQNNLIIKKIPLSKITDKQFKQLYSLFKELVKIKKFWIPEFSEFYKKSVAFKDSSFLIFAYRKEITKPIAALWIAHFKTIAVYMHVGINKLGYQELANYLLLWNTLKILKKMGIKTFDFEGIYDSRLPKEKKSWGNFSEFKRRFHGQLIEYPMPYIKCYNLFFKFIFLWSKILPR